MKHIADIQPGGFIVDNEYHKTIGEMLQERDAAILALAGNKAIISGVEADGANTTDGMVTFNGKIYRFIGGATASDITTKRIAIDRPNASQINAPAFYEDVIEFGTDGFDTFPLADLRRYYPNNTQIKEIKILGRNVTNEELAGTGWFLANGQNGTDNLVDRFFVVAGNEYAVGDTGGSKEVTLTEAEMPSHKHGMENGGSHDASFEGTGYIAGDSDGIGTDNDLSSQFTKQVGGDQPHENRPPYYAVVAIQFMGV
jgi:microcystin-dependent protein